MGEYQKTVDTYTQAAQVSEALLKIGLCQRALGDGAHAKTTWEQVIKQFPKSDAARQARTLLAACAPQARWVQASFLLRVPEADASGPGRAYS